MSVKKRLFAAGLALSALGVGGAMTLGGVAGATTAPAPSQVSTTPATAAITGGTLTFTQPGALHWKYTLNGKGDAALAMTGTTEPFFVDDATGSGAGWNMELTSTQFKDATSGHTLGTTSAYIPASQNTSYTCTTTGSCTVGTNSVAYSPLTVPAGATAPTAAPIFNAAKTSGMGAQNTAVAFDLKLPSNVYAGTYASTWTFSLVTGP